MNSLLLGVLLLSSTITAAGPVTITGRTTVVRRGDVTAALAKPLPLLTAFDAALGRCLSPQELAAAARGVTQAERRLVLRAVEGETVNEEGETVQDGRLRLTSVGPGGTGCDLGKPDLLDAPEALRDAVVEHVVRFTIDQQFATAEVAAVDAALRGVCAKAGTSAAQMSRALQGLDRKGLHMALRTAARRGQLAQVLDVASQYGLPLACEGAIAEHIRDAKALLATQGEKNLELVTPEAIAAFDTFEVSACRATWARLRWSIVNGRSHAVVLDHLPRDAAVERCLTAKASGVVAAAGNTIALVDYGADTDPQLNVRVLRWPADDVDHGALRAHFAPLDDLSGCKAFDPDGPIGRVTVTMRSSRDRIDVDAPQPGIASCVRRAFLDLGKPLPRNAALQISFLVDGKLRAARVAARAPAVEFMRRVCAAADGPAKDRTKRIEAFLKAAKAESLDDDSSSLVAAYFALNPADRKSVLEGAADEAGIPCPSLLSGPRQVPPAPPRPLTLQERVCAAYVDAGARAARAVYVAQEATRAEQDAYVPLATLAKTNAFPADFKIEIVRFSQTAFLARLIGTGPNAGEIWEVTEQNEPQRKAARAGPCSKTPYPAAR